MLLTHFQIPEHSREENSNAITALEEGYGGTSKHRDFATSFSNIGSLYRELGAYKSSLQCYQKAQSIWKSIYGDEADHFDIATTYRDIAVVHRCLNEYSASLEYCQKSIAMFQSIDGGLANNLDLAWCYNIIGDVCSAESDYKNSLDSYEKSLELMLSANADGVEVADIYNRLGEVSFLAGDSAMSLEYHELSAAIFLSLHKDMTSNVKFANSLSGLANIQKLVGNYGMSFRNDKQALEIKRNVYGSQTDHPEIANSYRQLGRTAFAYGRSQEALEFLFKAIKMYKVIYGTEIHDDIAATYNAVACAYGDMAEYVNAIINFEKVARIAETVHAKKANHFWIATAYCNLAGTYIKTGESRKALEYGLKGLNISYKMPGRLASNSTTAGALHVVGAALNLLGNYKMSLEYALQGLNMRKAVFGVNVSHRLTSSAINTVGNIYRSMGQYTNALKYYDDALDMNQKFFVHSPESAHVAIAEVHNNIGCVYFRIGCFVMSLQHSEKALEILKSVKHRASNHPYLAEALRNIANICLNHYKQQELAIAYYSNAVVIATLHGKIKATTVSMLLSAAEAWLQLDQAREARILLRIAQMKMVESCEIDCDFLIGKCFLKQNYFFKAWEHLASALSGYQGLTPCNRVSYKICKTHILISELLLKLGRISDSLEHAQKSLELASVLLADAKDPSLEYQHVCREATSLAESLKLIKVCQYQFLNFAVPTCKKDYQCLLY